MLLGNVHILWLLGSKHITLSDKKERARIAVFLLELNGTLGLKLFVLLNLYLTMHLSLTVFETAKLFSNNKPFLLKDYPTGSIYCGQKKASSDVEPTML